MVPSGISLRSSCQKSGDTDISKSFDRKEDAVKYGRELSKKEETELYVHKRDGLIQLRNSYSKKTYSHQN
ncbi:MAG: DUF2188 domain-containing protein [Saprospiraceae bacterium]|nr:DUF2188 domain-containing protein [Saprospiraceae bacterium]